MPYQQRTVDESWNSGKCSNDNWFQLSYYLDLKETKENNKNWEPNCLKLKTDTLINIHFEIKYIKLQI